MPSVSAFCSSLFMYGIDFVRPAFVLELYRYDKSTATPFAWFEIVPGLPRTSRTTQLPLFQSDLSECLTHRVIHTSMPANGRLTTGAALTV
jgi:hypothetical protein